MGGFFGRLSIYLAVRIVGGVIMGLLLLAGLGPDAIASFLIQGLPTWVTPADARLLLVGSAASVAFLLLFTKTDTPSDSGKQIVFFDAEPEPPTVAQAYESIKKRGRALVESALVSTEFLDHQAILADRERLYGDCRMMLRSHLTGDALRDALDWADPADEIPRYSDFELERRNTDGVKIAKQIQGALNNLEKVMPGVIARTSRAST